MCKAETGSRLTCITALWLERKEKHKQSEVADDEVAGDVATTRKKVRHKRTLEAEGTSKELASKAGKAVKKRRSKRNIK